MRVRLMFEVILLCIFSILLSGCNAEYNLVIDDNNKVNEKVKVTIPNDLLLEEDESVGSVLDDSIDSYKHITKYKDYNFTKHVGKNNSYIIVSKDHKTLEEYSKSPLLKNVFQNLNIVENENYTIFKTVGEYYYDYLYGAESEGSGDPAETAMQNVEITIQLQNKLIECNADIKDEKNNVYTWKLEDNNKGKYIYIKYSHEKRYDIIIKSFIFKNILPVIAIATIIVILLSTFLIIGGKSMINNKI